MACILKLAAIFVFLFRGLMASHNQKGHVTSHFDSFDLRNEMVPLMMALASYHTDTDTNGTT